MVTVWGEKRERFRGVSASGGGRYAPVPAAAPPRRASWQVGKVLTGPLPDNIEGITLYIVVSPAYGRDYKLSRDAAQAWEDGKDFVIESIVHGPGRYVSKRDLKPGDKVQIRFDNKSRVIVREVE